MHNVPVSANRYTHINILTLWTYSKSWLARLGSVVAMETLLSSPTLWRSWYPDTSCCRNTWSVEGSSRGLFSKPDKSLESCKIIFKWCTSSKLQCTCTLLYFYDWKHFHDNKSLANTGIREFFFFSSFCSKYSLLKTIQLIKKKFNRTTNKLKFFSAFLRKWALKYIVNGIQRYKLYLLS